MKINKIMLKIVMLSVIVISALTIKSNAAIQIVPTAADKVLTNVTVSTSFKTSRDLDSLSSTLGTTRLDPHMSTNKDWGAVAYLANSAYGVNATYDVDSKEGKVGKTITINGTDYYSTTPNISGVMNWGGNPNKEVYTQSAGILNSATESSVTNETTKKNISLLLENKGNKYVEGLVTGSTNGMAIQETHGWPGLANRDVFYAETCYPICIRYGLFGYAIGGAYNGSWGDHYIGSADSTHTFRPVIWNIE